MFAYCADPHLLEGLSWLSCYVTTGKHMAFYQSFLTVMILLAVTAPAALLFGLVGAVGSRSSLVPIRALSKLYISLVRGVPDIVFFLFVPIALDQAFEYARHQIKCPDVLEPVRQGNDFVVCAVAKLPLNSAPQWIHEIYGFALAVLSFAFVFGAFAGNTLRGAFDAVSHSQLETAAAYGMNKRQIFWRIWMPQMWVYALPGLSNLWMILIKATPLLFLLGVEDIVYWARELGSMKTNAFSYPHPDWRLWYFLALLLFYLGLTKVSEVAFRRLMNRYTLGQATSAGKGQGQVGR